MPRSLVTIDLGAIRHNVRVLREALGASELWAVVKADGYGHGAEDVARIALENGAAALCVATVGEAVALRPTFPDARILVLGPTPAHDVPVARDAGLELTAVDSEIPEGVPVHLKLDTGMGRWGLSELLVPGPRVVGLMTHFATADSDLEYARGQLERFVEATRPYVGIFTRHAANSAAALMLPESRLDAARCGIALYGIDPRGASGSRFGLRPALRWESEVAQVKQLEQGQSTGYGRRFVAENATWIAIVPLGYADGFRRDMTGTTVLVGSIRAEVVGTVSMDAFAVAVPSPVQPGTTVTIVGDGITLEDHARTADTIAYELACTVGLAGGRTTRVTRDA